MRDRWEPLNAPLFSLRDNPGEDETLSWAGLPKKVGVQSLAACVEVIDFVASHFRHGKTLLAIGASAVLLERASASAVLAGGDPDPGVLVGAAERAAETAKAFILALGRHRHPEREIGALEV